MINQIRFDEMRRMRWKSKNSGVAKKEGSHKLCIFCDLDSSLWNTTDLLPKVPHHNLIPDDEKRS